MTVNESSTDMRRAMVRRLSGSTAELPLSSITRLQQASNIAAQGGFRRVVRAIPGRSPRSDADRWAAERIVLSLGRLKGVPMKLGQLAGYMDSSIPEHLRPIFSALETQAQPVPFEPIRAAIAGQLGSKAQRLLEVFERQPVTVGAFGQVHRAELDGVPVVVKVRYPNIEKAIQIDFKQAAFGARAMTLFRRRGRRGDALVRGVQARLNDECAFGLEAERQIMLAKGFEEHPAVAIPPVFSDYSSDAVVTSRAAEGLHLDDYLATRPSEEERQRVGLALFDFYVGSPFVLGAYNTDPHAGSYLFSGDGRVTIVDHGAGRMLSDEAVDNLRALARATLLDDRRGIRSALASAVSDGRRADEQPLHRVLSWLVAPMRSSQASALAAPTADEVREIAQCVRDVDALTHPEELVFLVRHRIALSAVLARLGARANWREAFEAHLEGRFFLRHPNFDVVLVDAGPRPIELLRVLRDELGGAVREAQALIDSVPCAVTSDVDRKSAHEIGLGWERRERKSICARDCRRVKVRRRVEPETRMAFGRSTAERRGQTRSIPSSRACKRPRSCQAVGLSGTPAQWPPALRQ